LRGLHLFTSIINKEKRSAVSNPANNYKWLLLDTEGNQQTEERFEMISEKSDSMWQERFYPFNISGSYAGFGTIN